MFAVLKQFHGQDNLQQARATSTTKVNFDGQDPDNRVRAHYYDHL